MSKKIEDAYFGRDHHERLGYMDDERPKGDWCNCTLTEKGCLLQDAEYYAEPNFYPYSELKQLIDSARAVVKRINKMVETGKWTVKEHM